MEREIDQMAESESDSLLDRRLLLKGKTGCEEKVEEETDHITCRICGIRRNDQIKQTIYSIMNCRGQEAYYHKTEELLEFQGFRICFYDKPVYRGVLDFEDQPFAWAKILLSIDEITLNGLVFLILVIDITTVQHYIFHSVEPALADQQFNLVIIRESSALAQEKFFNFTEIILFVIPVMLEGPGY